MSRTTWCRTAHKVAFASELDAKIALSRRVWKEKGEKRYYSCSAGGKTHFHLTSQEKHDAS